MAIAKLLKPTVHIEGLGRTKLKDEELNKIQEYMGKIDMGYKRS
jgi:hypothetical protein